MPLLYAVSLRNDIASDVSIRIKCPELGETNSGTFSSDILQITGEVLQDWTIWSVVAVAGLDEIRQCFAHLLKLRDLVLDGT